MPREQITYNRVLEQHQPPDVDGVPSAVISVEQPRRNVHVAWNRTGGSGALNVPYDTGWVQIALEVTVAQMRDMLATAEAQAKAEAARNADFGEFDTEQYQFRISSDVLDRRETNDTIRVLRRARNAAYGADE